MGFLREGQLCYFPWVEGAHQFDKAGYPREVLRLDSEGTPVRRAGMDLLWVSNLWLLGDAVLVEGLLGERLGECVFDLQTADDCYCADLLESGGEVYISLQGSGWADLGFPFYDDAITVEDPYRTGLGCYALVRGAGAERFRAIAAEDRLPDYRSVVGEDDWREIFVLPAG